MKDRPLIAHVLFRFDVGGLENGVVNLINRLPEDRFRHVIVALQDYTDFRNRLNREVPVYALQKKEGKDLGLHLRLFKLFRDLKPDIVHTRNLNAVEAQFPAWLAGVRGRVHGEHGWDVHDLDGSSRKYRIWRRLFRPFVQQYIPLSRHLANYLRNEVGVPADRISCICNGVDTSKFSPPPTGTRTQREEPCFAADRVVIGTVGRMEEVKNHMTLARAFVAMVRQEPALDKRVSLVIVGDGRLRESVATYLHNEGMSHLAWLPGRRDDTADLLQAMDIFVLPSLAEGISNTILEAMACGRPVIATDVGGNKELVQDGLTGTLVPSADVDALAQAMGRYVHDAGRRKAHGANGRASALENFSLQGMVDRYLRVYESVLYPERRQDAARISHRN